MAEYEGYRGNLWNGCDVCGVGIPSSHSLCKKHFFEKLKEDRESNTNRCSCGKPMSQNSAMCTSCYYDFKNNR